jgi:hypothetical protein
MHAQMERAAGFTHADAAQVKLDKLDVVLALASTSSQDAALFAEMLSLPNDGRYPTLELTPQQRRQKTLEALFAQVEAYSLDLLAAVDLYVDFNGVDHGVLRLCGICFRGFHRRLQFSKVHILANE